MLEFEIKKIARIYRDVPAAQVETLHRFRAAYPYKKMAINNVPWRYIAGGQGTETVLLLPGAHGTADLAWLVLPHFADRYRVVSLSYPPVNSMAALADGISTLLTRESIRKAHVVGGSYGGFLAQVFVRHHPDKTDKLVLSHTSPPDPRRGKRSAGALRWLTLLPMGMLQTLFRKRLAGLVPEERGGADLELIKAQLREIVGYHLTKESIINTFRRVVEFDMNFTFTPKDLQEWPGSVLLIMSDNDPGIPEPVREAMKALYPQAKLHIFSGMGHAAPLIKRDEYLSAIETFLASGSLPDSGGPHNHSLERTGDDARFHNEVV